MVCGKTSFVVLLEKVNAVPPGSEKLRHLLILDKLLVSDAESFFDKIGIKGGCVADPNCPFGCRGQGQGKRIVADYTYRSEADIDALAVLVGIGEQQVCIHLVATEDVKRLIDFRKSPDNFSPLQ